MSASKPTDAAAAPLSPWLRFVKDGGGTTAIRLGPDPEFFAVTFTFKNATRKILGALEYTMTPDEDTLLARFEADDTGPDFWRDVEAAGLLYAPKKRRRADLVRFSTSKPFNALTQALTHTRDEDWATAVVETGHAAVSAYAFAGIEVRLARTPSPAALATWFPEGDTEELAGMVRRYGGQKGALLAQATTALAALYHGEALSLDDPAVQRALGYKRPGGGVDAAEHLKAWKRDAYGSMVLGTWAAAVGEIFTRGEHTGSQVWSLYAIDSVTFNLEGTPEAVTLAPAGLSRILGDAPDRFEYLGRIGDLLALPDTTPGEWARAILRSLRQHWRMKVTTAECRQETKDGRAVLAFPPITRRLLFHYTQPEPTPADVLAGDNPHRAVAYFEAAMNLLEGKGSGRYGKPAKHVSYWRGEPTRYHDKAGREPWPGVDPDGTKRRARRGVDWRKAWLEQPLDIRPGGVDLAELLEIRATSKRARKGLKQGE